MTPAEETAATASAGPSRWVAVDVVMRMFKIGLQQAYRLARQEGWRPALGTRPKRWAFDDVHKTWVARKQEKANR